MASSPEKHTASPLASVENDSAVKKESTGQDRADHSAEASSVQPTVEPMHSPPPLPARRSREDQRLPLPPLEKPVVQPVAIPASHVSEKKANSAVSEDEFAHGPLIGDATWEERTWKEIVRLREDMFWARVGGLR